MYVMYTHMRAHKKCLFLPAFQTDILIAMATQGATFGMKEEITCSASLPALSARVVRTLEKAGGGEKERKNVFVPRKNGEGGNISFIPI